MSRILVLDGDVCLWNVVREVLQDEGYTVVEADNDYEGLPRDQAVRWEPEQRDTRYLVAF